jgi:hypothetical protein
MEVKQSSALITLTWALFWFSDGEIIFSWWAFYYLNESKNFFRVHVDDEILFMQVIVCMKVFISSWHSSNNNIKRSNFTIRPYNISISAYLPRFYALVLANTIERCVFLNHETNENDQILFFQGISFDFIQFHSTSIQIFNSLIDTIEVWKKAVCWIDFIREMSPQWN